MGDPGAPREHQQAVQYLWYGHKQVPSSLDFDLAWKAVKAIAAGDGVLSEPERLWLIGRMSALLTPPDVIDAVMAWDHRSADAARLLAAIHVPPELGRSTGAWIVYNGLSVAMADGDLAPGELEAARGVAISLGVDAQTFDALHRVVIEEADVRRRRLEALGAGVPGGFRRRRR